MRDQNYPGVKYENLLGSNSTHYHKNQVCGAVDMAGRVFTYYLVCSSALDPIITYTWLGGASL